MFNQLNEMIARQQSIDLNQRLERLYVPADPAEKTGNRRDLFAAFRRWFLRAGTVGAQRRSIIRHGRNVARAH